MRSRSPVLVLVVGSLALPPACGASSDSSARTDAGSIALGKDARRALYARTEQIVTDSCARETCHGELVANAHMDLMQNGFRAAMVGVASCEYDRMQRVEPGHPERSWVMIKLAGPVKFRQYADFIDFMPPAGWKPLTPECSGMFDDGAPWFGTRMPPMDSTMITPDEIDTIRAWIRAGAPGPDG